NRVPLSPHAICRAWGTLSAHTAILKPGGSLMVARILSSSALGVGVGWPGLGVWPFCSLFSSPRNQSGGGFSQKSLLLESYFLRSCACTVPEPQPRKAATTPTRQTFVQAVSCRLMGVSSGVVQET